MFLVKNGASGIGRRYFSTNFIISKPAYRYAYPEPGFLAPAPTPKVSSVLDEIVHVTFIDCEGKKYSLSGYTGQSLVDICRTNKLPDLLDDYYVPDVPDVVVHSERWSEDTYSLGVWSTQSHVVIPKEWFNKLPKPIPTEVDTLNFIAPDQKSKYSRIGSQIKMTRDLDGIVVYVPDARPLPPIYKIMRR